MPTATVESSRSLRVAQLTNRDRIPELAWGRKGVILPRGTAEIPTGSELVKMSLTGSAGMAEGNPY